MIVFAINEHNVGSGYTSKIITPITNNKINLFDSKYKCITLRTIIMLIILIMITVGTIIYFATK